ncbi:hypothetical protein [Cryptosporangium aurantiacum]|uniref:4-amino-4-deoxy-L-arabinose transferase n=1 Tax=Cryptosporangium aurantiacum TaxID=134849 RepID=A0A1M7N2E2_9ACTN|nr:hypothetical protein [Cryptosporangium aurantiacum]SHM97108.1 hypothetical protein SAMN05443668_102365 [Cryptosporangium aurantiacum]
METVPALDRTTAPEAPVPAPTPPRRSRTGLLVALLAIPVGWVLPWLTHEFHLDGVLPILLLVGIASLLRGGRTLLDRLAIALLLMLGVISAAGLLFSVWPWGLDPVPVARAGFLSLVAVGLLARRLPQLPTRVNWGDALLLLGGAGPALYLWTSFWSKSAAERMGMMIGAEDLARHFTIFDTIRSVGGYLPFHRGDVTRQVIDGVVDYPQASHLSSALMDNFARSSTELGEGMNAFDHYLAWNLVGFGILSFALVWGARWVAGRTLRGWRLVAAVATIAFCTGAGYLVSLFDRGYPSEVLGLALVAMVLALAARPVRGSVEQTLLLAAGVIGVSFTYYFFLPVAGAAVLYWAWTYRRSALRGPRWGTLVIAVAAAPLVLYWPVISIRSGVSPTEALLPIVGIPQVDRRLVAALCVLVFLGTLTRAGRRNPVWRSVGGQLALGLLMVAAIGAYQIAHTGGVSYYFEKAVHGVLVSGFVGLGAVGLLLPADPFRWGVGAVGLGAWLRRLAAFALPATASVLAAALAYGVLVPDRMLQTRTSQGGGITEPAPGTSRGRAFHATMLWRPPDGKAAVNTYRRFPDGNDGRVTIVVTAYRLYVPSLFLAGLRRQGGEAWKPVSGLNGTKEIATLEHVAEVSPKPVRFVVSREDLATGLREVAQRRPELKIELVVVPDSEAPTPPALPPPWR